MSSTEWQLVRSPEGIDLRFGVATASERLAALAIDLLIVLLLMFASVLVLVFLGMPGAALLAFFLLRQGYFIWFETRGNGTTFGKRRFHQRMSRNVACLSGFCGFVSYVTDPERRKGDPQVALSVAPVARFLCW